MHDRDWALQWECRAHHHHALMMELFQVGGTSQSRQSSFILQDGSCGIENFATQQRVLGILLELLNSQVTV